jgi:hypothetical protein
MTPLRYLVLTKTREKCDREGCTREDCWMTVWHYALPSGEPVEHLQPGDIYFNDAHGPTPEAALGWGCPWTNCDGRHLTVILPASRHQGWNIDGRCRNCTLPGETTHRCWVRHGDPAVPDSLHVDKAGHTCDAGAGSIAVDGYHGHLHNGVLT